jgi:ABC-2 type transport system ATP-binding protein
MEEAERLCDRIGILEAGRLVAEGTRSELVSFVGGQGRVRLEVHGDVPAAVEGLAAVAGVGSVDAGEDGVVCLVDHAAARLSAMLAAVGAAGAEVVGVDVSEPDLEDVFLHLTGRALRD